MTDQNGDSIAFDKLLIATGGTPIFPPIEGSKADGVFSFTTYENACQIEKYIESHNVESVVVLGGGLIGLKATEALMDLNLQVTVVELADRILSATFDRKASGIIEKALRQANCDVLTGDVSQVLLNRHIIFCRLGSQWLGGFDDRWDRRCGWWF